MNLSRRVWPFVVLALAVTLAVGVWADLPDLLSALAGFPPGLLPVLLLLTLGNQALRWVKWEYLLDEVEVDLPRRLSLHVFGSGLVMILTPGKLGEVWKSWLVRDAEDVPVERTMPVVAAERLTDLLGVTAIASLGVLVLGASPLVLVLVLGLALSPILVVQHEGLSRRIIRAAGALPVVGRRTDALEDLYLSSRELLRPTPLILTTGLSVVSWGLECVEMWLILHGLGFQASLVLASFVFAFSTILGAASLLPGGVGVTEGSMTGLLVSFGAPASAAAGATIIVRAFTLWLVAGLAFLVYLHFEARRSLPAAGAVDKDW